MRAAALVYPRLTAVQRPAADSTEGPQSSPPVWCPRAQTAGEGSGKAPESTTVTVVKLSPQTNNNDTARQRERFQGTAKTTK